MKTGKNFLSTTHIILMSFLVVILAGGVLLSLPISWADGVSLSFTDALFTATTATCVTGLVVVPTVSAFSIFGQAVILCLIQIGGLGVITVISGIMIALHRKMGLQDRVLLQDAFNLNSLSGVIRFVKKVVIGTLCVEGAGALLYMTVFVPEFGAKGIWISVFTAVSAFCNAGMDIISPNSLCEYTTNPIINLVTCLLIVLGGLGFLVWWDVLRVAGQGKLKFSRLTFHSKLAITTTFVLIFLGALLIFAFEYQNPATLGPLNFPQKVQASLFQSVTTRTAGFATIPQENFTSATAFVCILLMFIGGSPVGTAGGIKTVTAAVIFLSAIAGIRNRSQGELFHRRIPRQFVAKGVSVAVMSFLILFISTVALSAVTGMDGLDVLYETVSATATVGLTRNVTAFVGSAGKWILMATMYLGRVGPISLAVAFKVRKGSQQKIENPEEEIIVG
ncbi:MAG: potassium transporter KtrB [Clostridia bacterium]|nr:potassium transporter KtrB [Clostridia bacterium]